MAVNDYSPTAKQHLLGHPKTRAKLLKKIAEDQLQYEQLWAKRHVMSRDYPELDIVFPLIERQRKELDDLYHEIMSHAE